MFEVRNHRKTAPSKKRASAVSKKTMTLTQITENVGTNWLRYTFAFSVCRRIWTRATFYCSETSRNKINRTTKMLSKSRIDLLLSILLKKNKIDFA